MLVWPTSHVGMLHPAGSEKAQQRCRDFVTLATAAIDGISYSDAKQLFTISSNQVETRKSLFEEIGLLYVPHGSGKIILTALGRQFYDIVHDGKASESAKKIKQATALLVFALSKCQVNRPQSHGSPRLPAADRVACEIRPYAALWQAIRDLGGHIALHEFMGPMRRLWSVGKYDSVIDEILSARKDAKSLATSDELTGKDEGNYRIYWVSHMSLGDSLLSYERATGILSVVPNLWSAVETVLQFQAGCTGSKTDIISARTWSDVDDYYSNLVGAACPHYLASGTPKVVDLNGQSIADLTSFSLDKSGAAIYITGGPSLCQLPVLLQCFHPGETANLLRIDAKEQRSDGSIRLRLGAGRPITDLTLLKKTLGNPQ